MSASTQILKKLLEKIGNEKLATHTKYKSFNYEMIQEGKQGAGQFAGMYVVDFQLNSPNPGECEKKTWVIKLKNIIADGYLNNDKLFFNEQLFYNEVSQVLPDKYHCLLPAYVYSQGNGDEFDCVILQKLDGYGPAPYPFFELPHDHVMKMIEVLGQFHAGTYILKETRPEKFHEIVAKINKMPISAKNVDGQFMSMATTFQAAVQYVRDNFPDYDERNLEEMRRKFQWPDIKKTYDELTTPQEPISTIIHGDYNKFNVLFNYDQDKLKDIKMIDFQIITYASPSIDLAFVIFMNADLNERKIHMNDYLHLYINTVTKELEDFNCKSNGKINLRKYSRNNFMDDFRRNMWQGLGIAIGFKVEILGGPSERVDDILLQSHTLEYIRDAVENELLAANGLREIVGKDLEFALKFLDS